MKTPFLKKLTAAACFLLIIQLPACLDPKAVTDFVSAAQQTIALVDGYGKDMMESCERIKILQPSDTDCSKTDVYPSTQVVQSILGSYITNLGRLADKDGATFSENLDDLEKQVKDLDKFDKDKVEALKNVGSFIAELAASGYRRKQLMTTIPKVDADFAKVLAGVIEFADVDYRNHLGREIKAIEFRVNNIRTDYLTTEPLAAEIALRELANHKANIEKKIASIAKFKEAMEKLIAAHHTLSENATNIDAEEVITELKKLGSEVKKLNKEIKAAF